MPTPQTPTDAQLTIETVSAPNRPAFPEAYTDQALTVRKPPEHVIVPKPPPSGSTTLGNIRATYATDNLAEIQNTASNPSVTPPPQAPNSWKIATINGIPRARDPYRNGGMIGQPFFNNQA